MSEIKNVCNAIARNNNSIRRWHSGFEACRQQNFDEFSVKPFKNGDYIYEVKKQGDEVIYTVSDGKNKASFPVLYSFGEGRKEQVYIFKLTLRKMEVNSAFCILNSKFIWKNKTLSERI